MKYKINADNKFKKLPLNNTKPIVIPLVPNSDALCKTRVFSPSKIDNGY